MRCTHSVLIGFDLGGVGFEIRQAFSEGCDGVPATVRVP